MKKSLIITILLGLAMPVFLAGAEALDLARAVQEKTPRHDYILQLLSHGSNPNIMVNGCPLIIYVTMQLVRKKTADEAKWKEILQAMLRRKVSVDDVDTKDYTALMYASFYGHCDAVTLLLTHGARADFYNNDNKSPISAAYEGLKSAPTETQKKQYAQVITLLTGYANKRK